MRIAFRADASLDIGTGHLMRCLTLARELSARGAEILFITREHPGHGMQQIQASGFLGHLLPLSIAPHNSRSENYQDWVAAPKMEDAGQTLEIIEDFAADVTIVDHYGLDAEWETQVRRSGCKIMAIDDLANRHHDCDYLLDQNFFSDGSGRYEALVPAGSKQFLGPRYALLKSEYAQARTQLNRKFKEIQRINLFVGGSDRTNLTGALLQILDTSELAGVNVDVILGANHEHPQNVRELAAKRKNTFVYQNLPDIVKLQCAADLAIGAGGSTTWERLCLGLPSIVISTAENQTAICTELHEAGLIRYLGKQGEVEAVTIKTSILDAIHDPEKLVDQSLEGQALVDGRGASRLAEVLLPSKKSEITIRKATSQDLIQYYEWVNDPLVRSSAFNQELVRIDDHIKWFKAKLRDPMTSMFVLEANTLPIGQIRFDQRSDGVWIDYSLDPIVRRRGWGTETVKLGMQAAAFSPNISINAEVLPSNSASLSVFRNLGFRERVSEQGIHHFVRKPH